MTNEPNASLEGSKNRRTQIIVALIGTATALAGGALTYERWRQSQGQQLPPTPSQDVRISGRVANIQTDTPVRKAEVSLEAGGVPESTESDSQGIFSASMPAHYSVLRLRVVAQGFKPYDRLLPHDATNEMLHVNLEPETRNTGPAVVRPVGDQRPLLEPQPPVKTSLASLLNTSLPSISGDGGPWAVIVFGDQERRDDVTAGLRSTLSGAGHDTVSLFRKVSDEQRLASDLFRGSADLVKELHVGRFSNRILVGKLALARLGNSEGIVFARATLGVHVVSTTGEILRRFDLSAKGGGEDESAARRRAIDELIDAMPREIPPRIE